jgi:hypothetical protein
MSGRALLFLLIALCMHAVGETRISALLEPEGPYYLGQQVRLVVEVETDSWFTTAPRYPEITVPGAIVLQPEVFAVNSTRREGPVTWTAQRQRYLIFPQRVGALVMPPIDIAFAVSVDGKPGDAMTLTTPRLDAADVRMPPGASDAGTFVTTPRLDVRETFDRELDGLEVGDAVTRSVTQTASGTFALLLPAVRFEAPAGVTAYPAQPHLDDRGNRGTYTATRVDSVTYVLEQAGQFELPPIEIHWFDIGQSTMRTETLAARDIDVAVNENVLQETESARLEERLDVSVGKVLAWLQENLIWLTVAAAALWLIRQAWSRLWPPALAWFARRRYKSQHGERAYYRRVVEAARRGDADAFVPAFWAWSDRLPGRTPPLTAVTDELTGEDSGIWHRLARSRYGKSPSTDARQTAPTKRWVSGLRKLWLGRRSTPPSPTALNP